MSMEDRYGGWRSMRNGDFQEEDIWSVLNESNSSTSMATLSTGSSSSVSTLRRLPTASRKIPRANEQPKVAQQSAPVTIPHWSNIYSKDDDNDDGHDDAMHAGREGDGDDEYEDHQMVPPHEWIARKLARNQMSSFSVFEGAGRTLKGRDLSRVRNAVLAKTGFLE